MYCRALGSVLIRRLSRRALAQAQAQATPSPPAIFSLADLGATVPRHARAHHTIRDLGVDGSYGAVYVASFAAFAASLYLLKKDTATEDIRMEEVTAQATSTQMPQVFKDGSMDDAAIRAIFTDKDGKLDWCDYIHYLTFGKTFPKATYQCQYEEVDDDMETKEQDDDTVDEAAMKAKFEQWMKKYDKVYSSEEETTMRYQRFKRSAKLVDKYNASKQRNVLGLNHFADMTKEELKSMYPPPHDDHYWERYAELCKTVRSLSKDGHLNVSGSEILKLQGRDTSYLEDQGLMSKLARREEAIRRLQEKARGAPSREKTEPHGPN